MKEWFSGQIIANEQILSQSTPLMPELEKAFDSGWDAYVHRQFYKRDDYLNSEEYILNLKIDI